MGIREPLRRQPMRKRLDPMCASIAESLRLGAAVRLAMVEHHLDELTQAATLIASCLRRGGKLLLFGNGGSAADAQHLAGEFVGVSC